jgi:DNA-binding XRE family transcriptional regulator
MRGNRQHRHYGEDQCDDCAAARRNAKQPQQYRQRNTSINVNARFSASLARLRQEQGLTKQQLAQITGLTTVTIRQIEQRKHGVTLASADAIATALGTTVDTMTGRSVPPEAPQTWESHGLDQFLHELTEASS